MNTRRRRLVAIALREVRRFAAIAAERAAQIDRAKVARAMPSFRPLTAAETSAILGDDLVADLSRRVLSRGGDAVR